MTKRYTDEERIRKFWERVDKGDDLLSCWEWTGGARGKICSGAIHHKRCASW